MRRLILALVFLACTAGPTFAQAPERFEPLPFYTTWWAEVQKCSGRTGRMSRVRWYEVPQGPWADPTYPGLVLYGITNGNDVYIAGGQLTQSWIVKHEMLHILGFHHEDPYPPYPWPFTGCAE